MELYQLTLKQAQEGLRSKKFSSVELVQAVLGRIKSCNDSIKAYITVSKVEALKQAKEADAKLVKGNFISELLGIPFSLKDNICTYKLKTTAAAKILADYIPVYDATVSERLKKAGAVIVGKTNLDAWAHGSSTETSEFFTTKNPWNLEKLPGGSSGGSTASVISDMTIASIGTETGGSIRQPASWCGVCGLKPTYGRVSRYGIISMVSSLDSPGPITKTAEDAALVFKTIAGRDPKDATTSSVEIDDYIGNLTQKVEGLKIGIPSLYFKSSDKKIAEIVETAIKVLEGLGMKVKVIKLMDPKYAISVYTILQRSEVSSTLARYDGIRYGLDRKFFGDEAKRRIMLGTHTLSVGYYDAYYRKALKVRTLIKQDFERVFKEVNVIIGPTSPCTALGVGATTNDPIFGEVQDMLVEPSTMAGLPGISIPCGFVSGLPVGMQIIGPELSESLILRVAHAYQKATNWHLKRPNIKLL